MILNEYVNLSTLNLSLWLSIKQGTSRGGTLLLMIKMNYSPDECHLTIFIFR